MRIRSLARYFLSQKALREALRAPDNTIHYRWLSTLFAEMDEMVLLLDEHSQILQANPSALRRLGYTAQELEGRSVHTLVKLRPERCHALFHNALQTLFSEQQERFVQLLEGTSVPIVLFDIDTIGTEGAIYYANSRFRRLLGWGAAATPGG